MRQRLQCLAAGAQLLQALGLVAAGGQRQQGGALVVVGAGQRGAAAGAATPTSAMAARAFAPSR